LLLSWLKTGQLSKFKTSEESFRGAAYINCVTLDDPELFSSLVKYESALMDAECARFARLEVMIPDLEKTLAAKQVKRQDIAELLVKLPELKLEKTIWSILELLFPIPSFSFANCKVWSTNCRTELKNGSSVCMKPRWVPLEPLFRGSSNLKLISIVS
jgi:hypothetical protein